MKSIKIVIILLQLSVMLLAGCSGMSFDPYDETKWEAKIYSNPPGAEIYVDGVSVGTAPLEYSYPSVGMSRKEVVAKFPSGSEQSLITGYYIFEILFDFINNKATIREYPEALSFFAAKREVSFESSVPLTPEMIQNALSDDKIRDILSTGEHIEPAIQPISPDISVGPLLEIFNSETGSGKLKVIADADGRCRVILFSKKLQQVLEIIMGPEGVVERRVICTGEAPDSIDAAFDAKGRLHVILDDEYFILDGDEWRTSNQTPWHDSGLKVWGVKFVPDAPDLTWAFQVKGAEVDAPVRMDIYGFGGYGAGIIWPWFTHGSRSVLVSEVSGGYGPWFVLAPQKEETSFVKSLASDRRGNVYVIYGSGRGGLAAEDTYFYLRIASEALRDAEVHISDVVEVQTETRRIRAAEKGSAGRVKQGRGIDAKIAADPESGTVLIDMNLVIRGKTWSHLKEQSLPTMYSLIDVVPGGQDSFHAMILGKPHNIWLGKGYPIQYLLFSAGAWSAPVELGLADVKSFGGLVNDKAGIAIVDNDKVFLVWPTEHGIVGRWIQRNKQVL